MKSLALLFVLLFAVPLHPAPKQIPLNITLKISDASPVKGTLTLNSFSSTGALTPLASWPVKTGGIIAAWIPADSTLSAYQINYVGVPTNGSLTFVPGMAPSLISTVHYFTLQITLDRSTGNVTTPGAFSWN
jgi:hypothetical protein